MTSAIDHGPPLISVLGAGSVVYPGRVWSSFVIDRTILLDAPPTLTMALRQQQIDPLAIETVLITHFHGDHFAGLPFLLLEFDALLGRSTPLTIIGPPNVQAIVEQTYELFYPGFAARPKPYRCGYIEARPGSRYEIGGATVTPFAMNHGNAPLQALGYRVERDGYVVAYTGDTAWCPEITALADRADVLIADCTYAIGRRREQHLSLDDIRDLRAALPEPTRLLLTHLGSPPDDYALAGGLTNTIIPPDGARIPIRAADQAADELE